MKKMLTLLLFALAVGSFAQIPGNRYDRISKQEFKELFLNRDRIIPPDLGDTVIIVRYSGQKLLNFQDQARKISFAKNGSDSTGLKLESLMAENEIEARKTSARKFAVRYPEDLQKELLKKGIKSIIVDETDLKKQPDYLRKYWLKTTYISTQKSLDDIGWVMTITNMFYDPRTDQDLEIFLPINYEIFDLILR